jgi:hypothetical protein
MLLLTGRTDLGTRRDLITDSLLYKSERSNFTINYNPATSTLLACARTFVIIEIYLSLLRNSLLARKAISINLKVPYRYALKNKQINPYTVQNIVF